MSNIGSNRNQQQLWVDGLLHANHPQTVHYYGQVQAGSFPVGVEIFINGEQGNRFYIPENSIVSGVFLGVSWSSPPVSYMDQYFFSVRNNAGIVEAFPADFGGAGPNPNQLFSSDISVQGWSLTYDDTLKALVVNFLAGVAETHKVVAALTFTTVGEFSIFPNMNTVIDNS